MKTITIFEMKDLLGDEIAKSLWGMCSRKIPHSYETSHPNQPYMKNIGYSIDDILEYMSIDVNATGRGTYRKAKWKDDYKNIVSILEKENEKSMLEV